MPAAKRSINRDNLQKKKRPDSDSCVSPSGFIMSIITAFETTPTAPNTRINIFLMIVSLKDNVKYQLYYSEIKIPNIFNTHN